jgi:hypothetical protein
MNDDKIKALLNYFFKLEAFVRSLTSLSILTIPGDIVAAIRLVMGAAGTLADAPGALAQWAVLSSADAADIEAFVVANYGANPDTVDSDIEAALNFLVSLSGVVGWIIAKLDPSLLTVKK